MHNTRAVNYGRVVRIVTYVHLLSTEKLPPLVASLFHHGPLGCIMYEVQNVLSCGWNWMEIFSGTKKVFCQLMCVLWLHICMKPI